MLGEKVCCLLVGGSRKVLELGRFLKEAPFCFEVFILSTSENNEVCFAEEFENKTAYFNFSLLVYAENDLTASKVCSHLKDKGCLPEIVVFVDNQKDFGPDVAKRLIRKILLRNLEVNPNFVFSTAPPDGPNLPLDYMRKVAALGQKVRELA